MDKKKILAGAGIATVASLLYLLLRRKGKEEPPPEGYGRVQGYVLDAETGAKIINAEILVDDVFHCYSDYHGLYRTGDILYGTHTITVKANNYETATLSITLEEPLMNQDLSLQPLPEAPTEWTEGVEVTKITVTPSTAYVGETIEIDVYIQYPHPLELPADIHGTILVNGTEIDGNFNITFRNPILKFTYTPSLAGTYTVKAQGKSASFTVIQDIAGAYYLPFGGTRMPRCTEITVPDVEPFEFSGISHPGGDYVMEGLSRFTAAVGLIISFPIQPVVEHLSEAYPTAWDPPGAAVSSWVNYIDKYYSVTIMPVEYDCQESWNSKDELAKMIALNLGYGGLPIPNEWILQYGTTCPTCDGTGQTPFGHSGHLRTCPTCRGVGKVFRIDLARGWRDWVKPIRYYSICGGGYCTPHIYCPYCDAKIYGPTHTQGRAWDKVSFIRHFLTHIETKHPNHPLTEPACF